MTGIDLHLHTTYCDGKHTPEEMIKKAVELKMDCLGICVHGHDVTNESWAASPEKMAEFVQEIRRLQTEYGPKIWLLAGVEQDYFGDVSVKDFDYVIGSVHWLPFDGKYFPVDESEETLRRVAETYTGGDFIALAEQYYELAGQVIRKTHADVIGHFDLIAKFNEGGKLFDESDPRYVAAWHKAADRLLKSGKPFEINTGAMSRGYRTAPYPSKEIREYLKKNGGKFLLTSDAHDREHLMYRFEDYERETDPEAYDFLQEL